MSRQPRSRASSRRTIPTSSCRRASQGATTGTADRGTRRSALAVSRSAAGSASIGGIFISAVTGLVGLALSVSFAQFVSSALARNDWVGWTARASLGIAGVAALVILVREIVGLLQLGRLARIRRDVGRRHQNARTARSSARACATLRTVLAGRADLPWALARVRDHERDVRDPGELLKLADRELIAPLDAAARRAIIKSAKRVSVVTAMSPMVWVAMLYVVVENLRMLRALAALYGGAAGRRSARCGSRAWWSRTSSRPAASR